MPRVTAALLRLFAILLLATRPSPAQDGSALGALSRAFLASDASTEWSGLDRLAGFRWAPLPPTSMTNCLANGDCFARPGKGTMDGREVMAMATGARTIVTTILLRTQGAALGADGVLTSLARAGVTATIARCPARSGAAATSWYRLSGDGVRDGILALQPPAPNRPGEGVTLIRGSELPALPPNQLANYSEKCSPGAARTAVATVMPHESVAAFLIAMLVPAGGAPLYDWETTRARAAEVTWNGNGPIAADLRSLGDPNPMMMSGSVKWAGREFSVTATGIAAEVRTIRLDEMGLHPRGEHMLGVVYARGITVRKVRCGPVYTESTNDWYALTSAATRQATVRQSIRYDGQNVQDAYELRLDATLPARDPRDRDPGTRGC